MKRNACQKCAFAVRDDNPHCGLRGFTSSFNVEWCEAENEKAPNGYELQEDGYFSWVKKKTKYPQSYEECCKILEIDNSVYLTSDEEGHWNDYELGLNYLIEHLRKLIICRDAYWKIAGEEMGLGKPWEPDWTDYEHKKFVFVVEGNTLIEKEYSIQSCILAFPTEEMRDAFYEAFKELIEECKELL